MSMIRSPDTGGCCGIFKSLTGREFLQDDAVRVLRRPNKPFITRGDKAVIKKILRCMLFAIPVVFSMPGHADEYPNKMIKIVVPYPPGGTTDALARILADKLRAKWGQSVVVENRAGAGGNIGAEGVWKSAPDGYTLLFSPPAPLVINKSLYPKLGFDPETFAPVSLVAQAPNVLVTSSKSSLQSVQQLIDRAKNDPNRLNYASQGSGSTSHLTAELFKSMAGVKMVHVPYKGSAPALTDLLGAQVDLMFVELSSVLTHIKAGNLRVLAVGSEKPNELLPKVPTISEVLPGFTSTTWFAMAAPPKTPAPVLNKLSAAIAEALKQPDVAKRLAEMSLEGVGSSPAETAEFMKRETELWGKVLRLSGTTVE